MPRWPALLLLLALGGGAAGQPADVRFEAPAPGTLSGRPMVFYGMVQDRTGYLWLATEEGLYRYDGVAFTRFRTDPDDPDTLPGDRVTALAEAPDGRLWALVDRFGLVRFDPQRPRFERFPVSTALLQNTVMGVDAAGAPWLLSASAALARLDPATGRLRRVATPGSTGEQAKWTLGVDGQRRVWLASRRGLYRVEGGRPVPVAPGEWAWQGGRPAQGRPDWLLRDGRTLYRLDPGARRPAPVRDLSAVPGTAGAVEVSVGMVTADRRGTAWVRVGLPGRLFAVDLATGAVTPLGLPGGRAGGPPALVQRMLEDREGVLWFGTSLGLQRVVPRWTAFRAVALPPTAMGAVLAAGPGGRVWAGALDGPLYRFVPGPDTLAPLPPMPGRPERYTHAVGARDGGLWVPGWGVTTDGGLLRVFPDGRTRRYVHDPADPASLASNAMRVVLEDAAGRTWVGTEAGLDRLDLATGRAAHVRLPAPDSAAGVNTIWALAEAGGGRLWVGTYGGGLVLYDPATGRSRAFRPDPADPTSISGGIVTAIHPSRAEPGVWWVGTFDGGLNRFEPRTGRFTRYTRRDGMPGLTVKSILEDRRGVLWVGTDAGLVRLDPREGEAGAARAPALRVFTEADGLPGVAFGLYDAAALPDGRLAFVVDDRVVAFDPLRLEGGRFHAPVVLRGLRVLGRERPAPLPGEALRLGPGDDVFAVEAAALSFTAPERILYSYRLDPVDADWVPMGTERTASFAHLPAGRYTLRIRAGTASGAWSPRELVVPVVVVPPWWATWWARWGAALLVLGGVAGGVRLAVQRRYRARIRRLEREREAQRQLQQERERISRDLHDHVGAQVASLLSGVELARFARRADGAGHGGDGETADPLDVVETDARRMLGQLRETIWALRHERVTLAAFRDRLEGYLRDRLRGRDCPEGTAVLDGPGDRALSPMQALNLYRIAQEAVSNAIKYADATRLTLTVTDTGEGVELRVADDGAFRPPADGAAPGGDGLSGYGLASMRARAEALGGRFALEAGAGGTVVRVTVPREAPAQIPPDGD